MGIPLPTRLQNVDGLGYPYRRGIPQARAVCQKMSPVTKAIKNVGYKILLTL